MHSSVSLLYFTVQLLLSSFYVLLSLISNFTHSSLSAPWEIYPLMSLNDIHIAKSNGSFSGFISLLSALQGCGLLCSFLEDTFSVIMGSDYDSYHDTTLCFPSISLATFYYWFLLFYIPLNAGISNVILYWYSHSIITIWQLILIHKFRHLYTHDITSIPLTQNQTQLLSLYIHLNLGKSFHRQFIHDQITFCPT